MKKSLGCVALALASIGATIAPIEPAAKDDYLIAVREKTLTFPDATLLANDVLPAPGPTYRILVAEGPTNGRLIRTATGFEYVGKAGFFGLDRFVYQLTDGTRKSGPATVRIDVSPAYVAFRADFNGDGEQEFGWFDSAAARFRTCYGYPGPAPVCATLWQAPANLAGRSPIAGDWNGDGKDDVGLFDSATGLFHLATSGATPLVRSFLLGAAGGEERPVAGDWNNDGVDTVGLYNPSARAFRLRNVNGPGPFEYQFLFGAGLGDVMPAVLRWHDIGLDAIVFHAGQKVHFYVPHTAQTGWKATSCIAAPHKVPLDLTAEHGLLLYDLGTHMGSYCDRITLPVDVYIPPPLEDAP
jgi:hypothetical protein